MGLPTCYHCGGLGHYESQCIGKREGIVFKFGQEYNAPYEGLRKR